MSKLPPELQHLTKDLPPDKAKDVEAAILSSPYLVNVLSLAVQQDHGNVKRIVISNNPNEGGHFDTQDNTIHIKPDAFQYAKLSDRYDHLVTVIGHETGHAIMSGASYSANAHLQYSVQEAANRGVPSVDLTQPVSQYLAHTRTDEGFAEVVSMNALASRIEHTKGAFNQGAFLERMDKFTQCVEGGKLQPGIVMGADGRIAHNLHTPTFEAMRHCQYDLPTTLGKHGDSNYRNYYGTHALELIATELDSVPKNELVPMVKLDLDRLGLSARQLERNGLDLNGQNLTIIDTSDGKQKSVTFNSSAGSSKNSPDVEAEIAQQPKREAYTPAPMMSEPGHPAHAMYTQALNGLRTSPNIPAGTFTQHEEEKLAAGIVAQALSQKDAFPKASVDHVVMSRDGTMVIGVQGGLDNPTNRLAGVNIQQALSVSSIEQSSDVARTAIQTMQQKQEQAQTQAETLGVDVSTPTGPIMRMGARTLTPASGPSGDSGGGDGGGGGGGG